MNREHRREVACRRGIALIAMLVLLSVFMLLAAGWVRRIVAERQEVRRSHVEIQTARLAESGLARAHARIAASADYKGEVWEISADSWQAGRAASVQIDIEGMDPDSRLIEIVARARFPKGSERAVQRTRRAFVRIPPSQP